MLHQLKSVLLGATADNPVLQGQQPAYSCSKPIPVAARAVCLLPYHHPVMIARGANPAISRPKHSM